MGNGDGLTELLGKFEGEPRFLDRGTRHHEFRTADLLCTVDDGLKVIGMALFPAVLATEYWVSEVDADLRCLGQSRVVFDE